MEKANKVLENKIYAMIAARLVQNGRAGRGGYHNDAISIKDIAEAATLSRQSIADLADHQRSSKDLSAATHTALYRLFKDKGSEELNDVKMVVAAAPLFMLGTITAVLSMVGAPDLLIKAMAAFTVSLPVVAFYGFGAEIKHYYCKLWARDVVDSYESAQRLVPATPFFHEVFAVNYHPHDGASDGITDDEQMDLEHHERPRSKA